MYIYGTINIFDLLCKFFLTGFLGGFWGKGKGHQPDVFGRTRLMAFGKHPRRD